jgi:heme/copper-type cytochrome/quinol oxidase subunit 2
MGCPVIGSVTESDVSKMFALMNAMIPVSVILVAFYFMKAVRRNGKNGNGKKENGKNEK